MVRCSRSREMSRGAASRGQKDGFTLSRVILMRAIVSAFMPPVYDASPPPPIRLCVKPVDRANAIRARAKSLRPEGHSGLGDTFRPLGRANQISGVFHAKSIQAK